MRDYCKTPFTYEQHVDLLKSRELIVENQEDVIKFLKQVNYYRLTAYFIPFQKPHDVFISGTTFKTVVNLYQLDEKLREAVFATLTPIEIFLRTRIAYELSHKWGAFAQYDNSIFQNETEHTQWLVELNEAIEDSKEPFLIHYKNKYQGFPRLPLWMACEIMSLGSLSSFYSHLTRDARLLVCSDVGIDHNVFRTWLHMMTFLRNICAHHGRLWSRNLSISPIIPNKNPQWQSIRFNNRKIFTSIAIMEWICRQVDLPLFKTEVVYQAMQEIADLDIRFAGWMGVPADRKIGMCWE